MLYLHCLIPRQRQRPMQNALLPPASEGTVFTGVCLFTLGGGRVQHLHPIIFPLVPCPFWGGGFTPVPGPFLGVYPSPRWGGEVQDEVPLLQAETGWGPAKTGWGTPPPPPARERATCYAMGSMRFAFMQEYFLIWNCVLHTFSVFVSVSVSNSVNEP